MTCPKCRTNVPDISIRCPGCGLSKPKARPASEDDTPSKWFGKIGKKNTTRKRVTARRKPVGPPSKAKRVALTVSIPVLLTLLSAGAYWFLWPLLASEPEPQTAALVLEKLRKMPSNQEGLTVEESVNRELEKSRRVGNLRSYQGWTVHRAPGDKAKLLVVFSFDERDNTKQRAEWLVDPASSTFTPQTELAAAVFK
ncbi:MAG TPA: hypothetical protein VNS63_01850 [Blastocatellia bacterium]|nr:hypothetical protein [Blastocatellia bacterium]